jgi:hypothetical protein
MARKALSWTARAVTCGVAVLACGGNPAHASIRQLPGSGKIINDPVHHAVFSCLIKHPVPVGAGQPTTLRLYLDSGGDIYPGAAYLPDNPKTIRWPSKNVTNHECDLQWYFDRPANQAVRNKLFAQYRVTQPGPVHHQGYDTVAWDGLRGAMAQEQAQLLNQATQNGKKPLVVLVHGFNVADYEHAAGAPCGKIDKPRQRAYYDEIQGALLAQRPELQGAVWLEVYWDGLQNAPLMIWGAAQASARYAGLALRDVLRRTNPNTPLRVFTHSAGGLVITQALWNNDAFEDGAYEHQITAMMKAIPTPAHTDVRVGMMVPALSPEAFRFYQVRTPKVNQPAYRIAVGQNRKDYAVNKGPAGCHKAGDTCMGADLGSFEHARKLLVALGQNMRRTDFCVTPPGGKVPAKYLHRVAGLPFEEHEWRLYFERQPLGANPDTSPPIMAAFLRMVLD